MCIRTVGSGPMVNLCINPSDALPYYAFLVEDRWDGQTQRKAPGFGDLLHIKCLLHTSNANANAMNLPTCSSVHDLEIS